ncbi:MAG: phosphotransferase [Candidatus Tectimicrobiota bacterium]|nr:MAG: phosphotransferase [Candidatus Tectomicrobia bacterium]
MILDLHIHTSRYSADSSLCPQVLIREAKRRGLHGVVVTEHDCCWDRFQAQALAQEHGFLFLRGMEVSTDLGHILVYGLETYVPGIMRAETLRRVVEAAGGAMVAAHPFRRAFTRQFRNGREPMPRSLEEAARHPLFALVDGIEVCNGGSADSENRLAMEVCHYLGLTPVGGSDAHSEHGIGYYATRFEEGIASEADVVAALKQGRTQAVMYHAHENGGGYIESQGAARFRQARGWC